MKEFNSHMEIEHSNMMGPSQELLLFDDENDETLAETAYHETVEKPTHEAGDQMEVSEGDVILVMRKTLYWPRKVLLVRPKSVDVEVFDKAKTIVTKEYKEIKSFTFDESLCKGRKSSWITAYKEAKAYIKAR